MCVCVFRPRARAPRASSPLTPTLLLVKRNGSDSPLAETEKRKDQKIEKTRVRAPPPFFFGGGVFCGVWGGRGRFVVVVVAPCPLERQKQKKKNLPFLKEKGNHSRGGGLERRNGARVCLEVREGFFSLSSSIRRRHCICPHPPSPSDVCVPLFRLSRLSARPCERAGGELRERKKIKEKNLQKKKIFFFLHSSSFFFATRCLCPSLPGFSCYR